jgi:chromate transporter
VFRVFLKLGITSFGGPIAHLGYFHDEPVVRRKWIDEPGYGDLVALCQFLPGPASSQVGFSLGVLRGKGLLGGLAAWFAFTMPSALILFAFALGAAAFTGPVAEGFLHGLKLVAVAVVAQAIWGMTRTLTPDRARAGIALAAVAVVIISGGSFGQIAAIALGASAGLRLCSRESEPVSGHLSFPVSRAVVPQPSFCLPRSSSLCRSSRAVLAIKKSRFSTLSTDLARSSSAVATSYCHCSKLRLSPPAG